MSRSRSLLAGGVVGLTVVALAAPLAHADSSARLVQTSLSPSTISTTKGSQFALATQLEITGGASRSPLTLALPAAPAADVGCELTEHQGGGSVTRVGSSWVVSYAAGLAEGRHALRLTCTTTADVSDPVGGLVTLKDEAGRGSAVRWQVPGNPKAAASSVPATGSSAPGASASSETVRPGGRAQDTENRPAGSERATGAAPAPADPSSPGTETSGRESAGSSSPESGENPAGPAAAVTSSDDAPGALTWVTLAVVAVLGVGAVVGVCLRLLVRPGRRAR